MAKPRVHLAILEGEEMLGVLNGADLFTYCPGCSNSAIIPVATQPIGCTIGDSIEIAAFFDQVKLEEVDPEIEKCPGYDAMAGSTPGVGAPLEAILNQADIAEAGMIKEVPVEVKPHSKQDWENAMDEAMDDLSKSDSEEAARFNFAQDMVEKHDSHARQDPEQEYDYFGELEEHPSGSITKSSGVNKASLAYDRSELFKFLRQSGMDYVRSDEHKRQLVVTAMMSWNDGLLKDAVTDANVSMILQEYRGK